MSVDNETTQRAPGDDGSCATRNAHAAAAGVPSAAAICPAQPQSTIKEKADHVRAARQARGHTCHWPGCEKQVPPAMWGCRTHWSRLPMALRNRIWRTYRIGQEETQTPSREYVTVAREVQEWINANA